MKATVLGFVALAALASATLCGRSLAAEWEPVTETESAVYLIDRTSLGPAQAVQSAWVLVTGGHGRGLEHYGSRTQLMVFDCDRRAVALKQYALHSLPGGQGVVLRAETYDDDKLEFSQQGPGSVGDQLLGAVCDR
ncbi:MAG TPA: surface-adhesin E family protein [Burkholderiales bacterium]|nr:surface-adhesin E family protein [Burkholderiales bacterium]